MVNQDNLGDLLAQWNSIFNSNPSNCPAQTFNKKAALECIGHMKAYCDLRGLSVKDIRVTISPVARGESEGRAYPLLTTILRRWNERAPVADYQEVITALLKSGSDWESLDTEGATALHWACGYGIVPVVDRILKEAPDVAKQLSKSDYDGWLPIHFAVHARQLETAEKLIAAGADVNSKNEVGMAPLHFATDSPNIEMVELLLKNGADVNSAPLSLSSMAINWSPIHLLARNEESSEARRILDLLIFCGASLEDKTPQGQTPEEVAKDFQGEGSYFCQHLKEMRLALTERKELEQAMKMASHANEPIQKEQIQKEIIKIVEPNVNASPETVKPQRVKGARAC